MEANRGDLFQTAIDLIIRKDGFTFGEADQDKDGKFPTGWLLDAVELPKGSLCTFIRPGDEDPEYSLVLQDLMGRAMFVRNDHLERVSQIDDADPEDGMETYTYVSQREPDPPSPEEGTVGEDPGPELWHV